jgi:predicted nucleic acid-binding protein
LIEEARVGRVQLVNSDYLLAEIEGISDPQRKADVLNLTLPATIYVSQKQEIESRAAEFAHFSILGYDALHIAAAEAAKADFLLTTDQSLLRRAQRAGNFIRVTLINPIHWPPPDRTP